MRTPVVSRSARSAAATTFAALALGVGLPLLSGGTPAFACGDAPQPPTATPEAPERHATDPVSGFIPTVPTSVTAGGKVEIGVELANFTGSAYQHLAPAFSMFNPQSSQPSSVPVNLRPDELTVEVMVGGAWKRLPLHLSCDPTVIADTSILKAPLEDGHAHRYLFRLGLSADAPQAQKEIQVSSGWTADHHANMTTLKINRPKAAPSKTPTAAPSTAPTTAAVPAAAVATATPSAAPTTPQPTAELAQTGGGGHTGFLLGSAAACLALGTTVLYTVRRRHAQR